MPRDHQTGEHDLAVILTLELLFRTEFDFVMNTARRCGLSDPDAEDVSQKVFLALQKRLHTLNSPESVRPWLATVTRRYALELKGTLRQREIELPIAEMVDLADLEPSTEELMLRTEKRRDLLDLLEAVEPTRRMILVMHVLDEIPMQEIAEVLQLPLGTVYNRFRLARQDLREAFARKDISEEYGVLLRNWQQLFTLRDTTDRLYGRTPITEELRSRAWIGIVQAIREQFGSFEAAEVDALRVLCPWLRANAPPRPYRLQQHGPKPKKLRICTPRAEARQRAVSEALEEKLRTTWAPPGGWIGPLRPE